MTSFLIDRYTIYTDENGIDWSVCFRPDINDNAEVCRVEYIGNGNISGRGYYIPRRTLPEGFLKALTDHCNTVIWLTKKRYAA